ncbi:MAG: hypothetical protein J6Z16_02160 [Candidatus Methanomethylophilaceae archaeon]|nr:hypothetical protein [Candidatus Methanomethylophilaceae archaeon]
MSGGIEVPIELPVMKVRYTATVHQMKRASGLEYVILKMVEAGHETGSPNIDIGQMMGVLSMHSDLFPLVAEEMDRLRKVGMLDYTVSRLEPGTAVRRIKVTDLGAELLAKNITSSEKKQMERTLVYRPWRKERFSDDENVPFIDRPVRIPFGPDRQAEAMAYVEEHRIGLGIDLSATIKNPKVDSSKTPSGYAEHGLEMYFDRSDGTFRLIGAGDLDLEYLRGTYTGDALMKRLPENLFETPLAPFEIKRWSESEPAPGCSLMLPSDLEMENGILFYGPGLSKVSVPNRARLPDDSGCDAVIITSRTEGRMLWFIRRKSGVEGFEGSRTIKMVAAHKMGRSEIDRAVDGLLSDKRISYSEELKVIDETARALNDDTVLTDRVVSGLVPGDVESLRRAFGYLGALQDQRWSTTLGRALEGVLGEWIDGGLPSKEAERFLSICSRKGVPVPIDRVIPKAFKRYGPLEAAEWGFSAGIDSFVNRADLAEAVSSAILSGEEVPGVSEEMRTVRAASESMTELKRITGIASPEGYRFDLSSVSDDDKTALARLSATLSTSMGYVSERFPAVRGTAAFATAGRLNGIYSLISDAVKRAGRIRRSSDLAAETNGLLFYSEAERLVLSKLRTAYGDLPREDLLKRFRSSGMLPLSDYKLLEDMSAAYDRLKSGAIDVPVPSDVREGFSELTFSIVKLRM